MDGLRTSVTVRQKKLGIAIGAKKVDGAKYVYIKSIAAGSDVAASGVEVGSFVVAANGVDDMKGIVAALKLKDRPLTMVCVAPSDAIVAIAPAAAPPVSAAAADGSVEQTKPERPAHDPPRSLKAAVKAKVLPPSNARSTVVVTQTKLGISIGARSAAGTKYVYVKTVEDGSEIAAGGVAPDSYVLEANGVTDMRGIVAALKSKVRPLTIVVAAPAHETAAPAELATGTAPPAAAPSAAPAALSDGVLTLVVTQAKLGIAIGARKVNGVRHVFVKTVSDACEAAVGGVKPGYYISGANAASDMKGIVAALKMKERPLTITFTVPDEEGSTADAAQAGGAPSTTTSRSTADAAQVASAPSTTAPSSAQAAPSAGEGTAAAAAPAATAHLTTVAVATPAVPLDGAASAPLTTAPSSAQAAPSAGEGTAAAAAPAATAHLTTVEPLTITFAAPVEVTSSTANASAVEASAADFSAAEASAPASALAASAAAALTDMVLAPSAVSAPLQLEEESPVAAPAIAEATKSAAPELSGAASSSKAAAPPPGAVLMRPRRRSTSEDEAASAVKRQEGSRAAEVGHAESVRVEIARAEAARAEAARTEAARADEVRAEAALAKAEQAKVAQEEAARAEAARAAAAQAEVARAEAARAEAEHVVVADTDAARADAVRAEAARAEAARVQAARDDVARIKVARAAEAQAEVAAATAQVEGDRKKRAAVERAVSNAVQGVQETQPGASAILEADAKAFAKTSQDAEASREQAGAKEDTDQQLVAIAAAKETAAATAAGAAEQVAREQAAVDEATARAARAKKKATERERQLAGAAVIPSRRKSLIGALAKGASGVRRSLKRRSKEVPDGDTVTRAQATQKKTVQVRFRIADQLHELWRKPRLLPDGTFEPRWKRTEEGDFDIANLRFLDLPGVYQKANLHAGHVACGFVELGFAEMKHVGSSGFLEEASEHQHIDWLKENPWCTDPLQTCTYDELSEYEKQKDREIVLIARKELTGYFRRLYKVSNPDISFEEFARDLAKFAISLRSSGKLDADSDVMEIWSDALRAVQEDGSVGAPTVGKKRRGSVAAMLGHIEKTRGRRRMSIVPKKRVVLRSSSRFTTAGSVSKLSGVKLKRGGMKWQPRHFFLQGHYLMYKKKEVDAEYADGVDLRGPESSITMSDEQTVCVQGLSAEEDEGGERATRTMELRVPKSDATDIAKWFKSLCDYQTGIRVSTFLTSSSSESTSGASGGSDATGVAAHVAAVKRKHEVEAIVMKIMIGAQRRDLATALLRFTSAVANAVAAEMRMDRQATKLKKVTTKCEAAKVKILIWGKWAHWVAYVSARAQQEAAAAAEVKRAVDAAAAAEEKMRAEEAAVEAAAEEAAAAAAIASGEDLSVWSEDDVASDLVSYASWSDDTLATAAGEYTADDATGSGFKPKAGSGQQELASRRQTSASRKQQGVSRPRALRSRRSRSAASKTRRARTAIDDALMKCSVFACLPERQIMLIADQCFTLEYNDGERIIAQGETNVTRWYVVASGEVAVHKANTRNPAGYQCLLGEGQLFGEQALLNNNPRAASVFARGATTVIVLSQALFETHMRPLERILEVHNTVRLQDEQLAEMRSEQHRDAVEAARQRAAAAQAELDRRAAEAFSQKQRAEYDRVALALRERKLRAAEELEVRAHAAEELRKRTRMPEATPSPHKLGTEANTEQHGKYDGVSTFWSAFNSISGEADDPKSLSTSTMGLGFEDAKVGARVLSSRLPYDSAVDGPLALGLRFSQRSGALARAATSPSGVVAGTAPSAAPLPRVEAGWVMHRDEGTGVAYWWNVETRETRWFPPLADETRARRSPGVGNPFPLGRSGRYARTPNPCTPVEVPLRSVDRRTRTVSPVAERPVSSPPRVPTSPDDLGRDSERSPPPGLQDCQHALSPTSADELSALRAELLSARAELASTRGIAPPEF